MRFSVLFTVLVGTLGAASLASAKPSSARNRVAVFPVVPVGEGVLPSAAGAMTEALMEELGDQGVVAEDKARVGNNAAKLIEEGRRDLARMQVPKAITALEAAVAQSDDNKQKAQASLLLAEAYYRRGDESKGQRALETVVRCAPDTKLAADRYPPVFIKAFDDVKARTGSSRAPASSPQMAATGLKSILAANVFDAEARSKAIAIGRSAGADTILILGMARGDRLFTLEAYAGHVRTGRWMALPIAQPDFDMLSSPAEASKLVRELQTFKETALDNVLVHGVSKPLPIIADEPVVAPAPAVVGRRAEPEPATQQQVAAQQEQLDRDSVLAADLAAIDGYESTPLTPMTPVAYQPQAYGRVERSSAGITSKWYFWVGVGVGAAIIGGTAAYLATRDTHDANTLQVQASW